MGVTIVDAIDTMVVMGLDVVLEKAKAFVRELDVRRVCCGGLAGWC